jgi:hypothetical protein
MSDVPGIIDFRNCTVYLFTAKTCFRKNDMYSTIFHEDWWLDIISGGRWGKVTAGKGSHVYGWLPFATFKALGMTACGAAPLTRVLHPVLVMDGKKNESQNRKAIAITSEIIEQLPNAHYTQFVLGPTCLDALAWQMLGFRIRIEHTFIIDTKRPKFDPWSEMRDKTRNLIRRARERLSIVSMSAAAFRDFYAANLDGETSYFDLGLIEKLHREVQSRDQGRILGAFDEQGSLHAAVFFIWDKTDYYYFLSKRSKVSQELGAVSLLVWHGILDAQERGLSFDFDGVTNKQRLQLMLGFGGTVARRTIVDKESLLFNARGHLGSIKRHVWQGVGMKPAS